MNVYLEILRVMACFMVLGVHAGQYAGISEYTAIGSKGVQLFFIISGFLAMQSCENKMFNQKSGQKWYVEYYKDRIKKIIPLYWYCLIINYAYSIVYYHFIENVPFSSLFELKEGVCGIRYLRYFFFLQGFIPSENYVYWNNRFALWSMSSFVFFYLVAPVLYRIITKCKQSYLFLAGIVVGGVWIKNMFLLVPDGKFDHIDWFAGAFPLYTLVFFAFGMFAWSIRNYRGRNFIAFLFIIFVILTQLKFWGYELLFTALTILATSLESGGVCDKVSKLLFYVGKESFCIYLTHPIIFSVLSCIGYYFDLMKEGVFLFIVFCMAGILGSHINYRVYEGAKSIRIKK